MAVRMITGLAVATSALGVAFVACGPSTSDDGTVAPVAPSGSATTSSAASSSAAASSSTAAESTSAEANACDGPGDTYVPELLNDGVCETTAPPNCLINEFSTAFDCTGSGKDKCWGDDTSLTGGMFTYQNPKVEGIDVDSTIAFTKGTDSLTFTGTSTEYAGFGFWFGPCTDASMWDGLEIQVTGELGGGELFVQLQTDQNYPVEADKGSCAFVDEDTKWTECSNPQFKLENITADGLNPIKIPWASFTGGQPNDLVDAKQLRGVQIQVGCDILLPGSSDSSDVTSSDSSDTTPRPTEPCAFNFELHDLRWFKN
jgi:hypothetical protein